MIFIGPPVDVSTNERELDLNIVESSTRGKQDGGIL